MGTPTFVLPRRGEGNRAKAEKQQSIVHVVLLITLFASNTPAGGAEKIRTAIPQANLNYLSIYVADARGFFKDEGLDNETVVISGPLATAALLSGDVDFSGGGGSGMRAALKGAPLKGIYFQTEKVTFYLVTDPSIKSAADLKGKRIAVGSPGDTQDRIMGMFAERSGVSAKELIRISMGSDTNTRITAIKTGAVHAAVVDPGGLVFAEKEGLMSLGFLGDVFPMPFQGFVTLDKKIRENPAQIKRWLRGAIRGLMFVRDQPEEAVAIGVNKLQLGRATRAMLLEGTRNYLRAVPPGVPGLPTAEGIQNFLEYDIKIPMQIKDDIAPERLLHLQLVEEVKKELEIQRRTTK
jgi:NitT/TauT family transport system substrate-binding protein